MNRAAVLVKRRPRFLAALVGRVSRQSFARSDGRCRYALRLRCSNRVLETDRSRLGQQIAPLETARNGVF